LVAPQASTLALRVPLPEGWSAQSTAGEGLRAGPPGRLILRIDRRAGEASSFLSAGQLRTQFEQEIKPVRTSTQIEKNTESTAIIVFSFTAPGEVGEQVVMLGAKRISNDLFLCASSPGRDLFEARSAAQACEDLSIQPRGDAGRG